MTNPRDPFAVAHFNALEDAAVAPRSTTEFQGQYLGMPGNSHYSRPTPDGNYLFVGAEAYTEPTGLAFNPRPGDIKVFDLSELNCRSPLDSDSTNYDPMGPGTGRVYRPAGGAGRGRAADLAQLRHHRRRHTALLGVVSGR